MRFVVNFVAEDGEANVIEDGDDYIVGMDRADEVRREIGLPNLDIKLVSVRYNKPHKYTLPLDVEEEQARESNVFRHTTRAKVNVPARGLNRFMVECYEVFRAEESGEVGKLALGLSICKDALWTAWAAAGYPGHWLLARVR